ncbi:MAG: hypothetical protein EIB84_06250 [Spiroplasma poulsonii]|uniref:Uncharacterized protein n=1 Tax=Spiroplasma poulsonii TaxID=2138 RepID=A0A2P6FFS9_9MOLU|nr:hypothetical protein [Spiroplasma poulsonii]KAF0850047.1 putative chitinase-like [Spiroplasma poulsonii]MBW1242360.1 hypothetical protein [Spiroplasma poulsonii]PQM32224.1 hypothetical protein SMSRO_SF021280 [Spiroplasma poulsonii]PWF94874.1 hypothetical protein SMSE_02980 [Spiroplasma poulsonii]PWF97671.1 hypothetical protein SMH99_02200 [Spiroplasma poulsonii]
MKKLLSLLSIITIAGTSMPTVIATSNYEKNVIKDLSELNWTDLITNRNKRDVNTRVIKTDGANKPTAQQIKDRLKNKNPQLDITKINVINITNNSATIIIIGFSGQKTINFVVDKSIDLSTIITNTNLGEIDFSNFDNYSYKQQIKDRLKELNPQLDITKIKVTIPNINNAIITSNDKNIYTGEIKINYSRPVKSVFKNLELGSIMTNGTDKPAEQQIKDRLKQLNDDLKDVINDFEISNITRTSAKISFNRKDILSGEAVVKFISNINLNKIITNNNLGEFITNNLSKPAEQQIKDRLKELNPQLDITKIKVTIPNTNNATITSNDNTFYSGNPINVNYTISISSINW